MQLKYSKTTLSAIFVAIVILLNGSIVLAMEASTTQPVNKQSTQTTKLQVVNINKGTFDQLVSLKGIGDTKARAIMVYRQQIGNFKSVDELTKISGIGKKIVNENKARLSI